MNLKDRLTSWYEHEQGAFVTIPFVVRALESKLTHREYVEFLLQYQFFVRTASPMYAEAAAKLPQDYDLIREWLFQQAYREFDHHKFIENDLKALGQEVSAIRGAKISPAMDILCNYNFGFIERHKVPIGIMGSPFVMIQLSAAYALGVAEKIKQGLGLKDEGVTFLDAHGHLDADQAQGLIHIMNGIVDAHDQDEIMLNAQANFSLYKQFLLSLG